MEWGWFQRDKIGSTTTCVIWTPIQRFDADSQYLFFSVRKKSFEFMSQLDHRANTIVDIYTEAGPQLFENRITLITGQVTIQPEQLTYSV